ncbi:MAG TPA: hypothetical protein VEA79_12975, partial [Phenylobacterium sp.]|nr:hypothetical protein [Phenylobacterium sp.]
MGFDPNLGAKTTSKGSTSASKSGGKGGFDPSLGAGKSSSKGGGDKKPSGKSFFGVRLPTVFGVNLPDVGVSLNTPGPVRQTRDLVAGAVPSLARLGLTLGKELAPENPLKYLRPGDQTKGNPRGWAGVERNTPTLGAITESMARTARQVPDTAVAIRPGGPGFGKSNLGRQIKEEGVLPTALAKVGDVAALAGGVGLVGRAAGAGRLAEATRLERLATASAQAAKVPADEFALAKAASVADAAGDTARALDLARAADQMAQANALRAGSAGAAPLLRGAEKVTAGAASVNRLGNKVAAAPFLPTQKALGLAGKGAKAAARSKTMAPLMAKAEAAVAQIVQKREIGDLHHENVQAPFQAEMHTFFQRHGIEDAARHLDADEQAAVYLTKSAEDVAARQLLDAVADMDPDVRPDVIARLFPDGDVTPAQIELAIAFRDGTLDPKRQAKLQKAAESITGA